jgi:hypothetical protein
MTAAQRPEPAPLTAADLGHPIRSPLYVDDVWRSCCRCHWWVPVVPPKGAMQ